MTNLAGKQEAFHVKNVALFALGAIAAVTDIYVDEEDPKHGHAHLRVGFHSGKPKFARLALLCLSSCRHFTSKDGLPPSR